MKNTRVRGTDNRSAFDRSTLLTRAAGAAARGEAYYESPAGDVYGGAAEPFTVTMPNGNAREFSTVIVVGTNLFQRVARLKLRDAIVATVLGDEVPDDATYEFVVVSNDGGGASTVLSVDMRVVKHDGEERLVETLDINLNDGSSANTRTRARTKTESVESIAGFAATVATNELYRFAAEMSEAV